MIAHALRHLPLTLVCGLLLSACGSRSATTVDYDAEAEGLWRDLAAARTVAGMHDLMAREVVWFAGEEQLLIERRTDFANAARIVCFETANGKPLDGRELERLNRTFAAVLESVRVLAPLAARHGEWQQINRQSCATHQLPMPSAELRLEGLALSAAASLALYDTFLLNCELVIGHEAIRRALNQGDAGLNLPSDQVDAVMHSYLSYGQRTRVHGCLSELTAAGAAWSASQESHMAYLRGRISASPSGALLSATPRIPLQQGVPVGWTLMISDLRAVGDAAVGGSSQGFGNLVGLVALRHGKLYGDARIEAEVRSRLRPGDILVEKTPFRLTDAFIPGHWGHAAIWIGGESELRALGLWDDPLVQAHAAALSAGHGVVEALRDGVQLNPLAHFLNIDDLGVLRQNGLTDDDRREIVRRSLRQLGKAYDFNFDVETADRIVCSELVYQVYTTVKWPTGHSVGRWTISPDQVARCGLAGGPLCVIDLWHDGRRVADDPGGELARLLKTDPTAAPVGMPAGSR